MRKGGNTYRKRMLKAPAKTRFVGFEDTSIADAVAQDQIVRIWKWVKRAFLQILAMANCE